MRMLFNHGITPEDLYTNIPEHITDKNWKWFIRQYGCTGSYGDALSDPFKFCIKRIIERVLDDKVRFRFPVSVEAYLDFETISGDRFEIHRQNGRFQNIDFIESDFTGYTLRYFYKAKSYMKSYQVYLGGELKEKFISKINSGEKFYTIKDITINDVIEEVYSKFPELSKQEVKKLLLVGFRRMQSSMMYGCAITINSMKFGNCYLYIGEIHMTPKIQLKEYCIRRDKKLRKVEWWKKNKFDGYYYIALNEVAFEKWLEDNKTARTRVSFTNVMPRKIKEELFYRYKKSHIFRIKVKKYKGMNFWCKELVTRDVDYVGIVDSMKFTEIRNETWKELIKNETRSN